MAYQPNNLTGVGTSGYLPAFVPNGSGLANSAMIQSGTVIGLGTTTPQYLLDVSGNIAASGIIAAGVRASVSGLETNAQCLLFAQMNFR